MCADSSAGAGGVVGGSGLADGAALDYQWYLDCYGGAVAADAFAEALPAALRLMRQVTGGLVPAEDWDVEAAECWRRACCAAVDAFAEFGEGRVGGYEIGSFKVTNYMEKGTTGREVALEAVMAELAGSGMTFCGVA